MDISDKYGTNTLNTLTGCARRVSSVGKEDTMGRYRIALMLITYLALIILFIAGCTLVGDEEKVLRLQARRSTGWSSAGLIYLELFYEDEWHSAFKFNYRNTEPLFSIIEVPLTEEMMETEFYIRFRNGIEDGNEYLDIDNIEIVM